MMTTGKKCFIAEALPKPFALPVGRTALVIIDMQRDFVARNGYGMYQCPSADRFAQVSSIVEPLAAVLDMSRKRGLTVIHTREGHKRNLLDCHASKRFRQKEANSERHKLCIGDVGPMGSLLVRGEYGHDIIDTLKPLSSEVVLDKPAKGSFCNTDFYQILTIRGITHLVLAGVTTECCVDTTFREANDRGFECCVLTNCTQGFDEQIVSATLKMFSAYDALLGYTCTSEQFLRSLLEYKAPAEFRTNLENLYLTMKSESQFILRSLEEISKTLKRDGNDKNPLSGLFFCTTPLITQESTVFKILIQKGAIFLGMGQKHSNFSLARHVFLVSTDTEGDSHASEQEVVFTATYGTISTSGLEMDCIGFDKVSIRSSEFSVVRKVWAELAGFDETDPYSRPFRNFTTPGIDYRGALSDCRIGVIEDNSTEISTILEKIAPSYVKRFDIRKINRAISLSKALHNQERGMLQNTKIENDNIMTAREAACIRHELTKLRREIVVEFETGNIHALLIPKKPQLFGMINALDLCAISSAEESCMLVTGSGLDWRIADIAQELGW